MTTFSDFPDFDDEFPVDSSLADSFRRDGHVCIRGVATAEELAPHAALLHELTFAHTNERRPLHERGTYGKAFIQVPNMWRRDERAAKFVLGRRFAGIAAALLGVEGVRLYHDQALFKEPGGGRTPWHQDQPYWPLDTDKTVTMWMPLVDVPDEVGSMRFASGSHRFGALGPLIPSDDSDAFFAQLIEEKQFSVHTNGGLAAGDTTWHNGWTLHSADANPTGVMRDVMTFIYFADGARVTEPTSRYQEVDRDVWLQGRAAGSLADDPLNPLVWSKGSSVKDGGEA